MKHIENIDDAQAGDRLEKLGWVKQKDGWWWLDARGATVVNGNPVRSILAAGLDRIIREVPEPVKVSYSSHREVRSAAPYGFDPKAHLPNRLWLHASPIGAVEVFEPGDQVDMKLWPHGTPEPLPEGTLEQLFPDAWECLQHHANEGCNTCERALKRYGLLPEETE